ncbi:MAG TPA: cold shock domain-containing protein [bacterium]|nr:cold shock domain-containing protein [bacterium]
MNTTVKKWFSDKSFGFLANGNAQDIFVRKHNLIDCEFLRPGTEVSFECHPNKKGLEARNVKIERPANTKE